MWLSFLGAFAITIYAMNWWGYRFPRFRLNSKVNYWWLTLAVATGLLNLGMSAGSWSHLLTRFHLVLETHSLLAIGVTIVWVGIREEFMFRYLFLWPLLSIKAKSNQKKIVWATLISSGIFGLFHAEHLFSGQALLQTCLQIFAAFGVGMLFSVITLYTGTIWITIILHLMIDLIGYPTSTSDTFAGSGMPIYLIEFIIITRIIELIVVFLILKNKNAQAAFAQTLQRIRKPHRNHDELKEG
jgi:membrane protease YdiL (CAAX protease family)